MNVSAEMAYWAGTLVVGVAGTTLGTMAGMLIGNRYLNPQTAPNKTTHTSDSDNPDPTDEGSRLEDGWSRLADQSAGAALIAGVLIPCYVVAVVGTACLVALQFVKWGIALWSW